MPLHLRPTAAIAPAAILTGDPRRAMEIATELLAKPLMSNLNRGLWGYHGTTQAGRELTVQAHGIGAPSAAVVLEELAALGVRRAIRIGTCRALAPGPPPGTAFIAREALADDGVSVALEAGGRTAPATGLTAALAAISGLPTAIVATGDLHYEAEPARERRRRAWLAAGARAADLASAALFAVGRRTGIEVAAALVVAEDAHGTRLGEEDVDAAIGRLAVAAADALARPATAGASRP